MGWGYKVGRGFLSKEVYIDIDRCEFKVFEVRDIIIFKVGSLIN